MGKIHIVCHGGFEVWLDPSDDAKQELRQAMLALDMLASHFPKVKVRRA
jgi:hypothetical protein